MSDKYYTYMYGTEIELNDLFQSGTTSGTTTNFKINENELSTLFAQENTFGYKEYFTQKLLTTYTTIPSTPNINYRYNGTDLIKLYKLNPNNFFSVIGNDTNFTTNPTGYNYCIRFINNGSIKFNTDTVVNIWMVGGGGSGGKGASAGSGGGGGGAGGVINFNFPMKNDITYNFTIGQGGQAVTVNSNGNNGESTTLSWTDILNYTIVVLGGGGGGNTGVVGLPGGSGGGASGRRGANESGGGAFNPNINVTSGPISYSYAKIISAPGTNGIPIIGTYANTSTPFTHNTTTGLIDSYGNIGSYGNNNTDGGGGGAGGGGAGGGGTPGNSPYGGYGGAGMSIPPLGTTIIIGGGGGGAAYSASLSYLGGAGGSGGGGDGLTGAQVASSGESNTGGGGGGTTATAAAGGSGVVYLFF